MEVFFFFLKKLKSGKSDHKLQYSVKIFSKVKKIVSPSKKMKKCNYITFFVKLKKKKNPFL